MPTRPAAPATPPSTAVLTAARAPRAARRRTRRLRPRLLRLSRLLAWLLAAWAGPGTLALAQVAPGSLPSGGQVVVGSGTLVHSPNLLVIQQNTARLGLDWQSFNIGSGATVEFRQPSASSVALNRVLGHSGTEIYGQLRANGQVFLTNPNGVLFAPGARVDVGGLVASTLDITQQDFADGRYVFSSTSAGGTVRNQGSLNASTGGYLALFGQQVVNQGDIQVDAGSVVLASGRAATVSISGSGLISAAVTPGLVSGQVDNAGRIQADGGVVTLNARSAQDIAGSLVNNSGIVRANTLVERGGEIWITGDQVASSGTLQAAAPARGNAGQITVKGDMVSGRLALAGQIDVSAANGRGGNVETSAAHVGIARSTQVDSRGSVGTGHWLIDPTDFTVAAGNGAQTTSGIGADTLASNLASTSITLATAPTGSEPGDIHVNADVTWGSNNTLTLQASRNINLNASLTATGTSAGLVLTPGTGGSLRMLTTDTLSPKITLSGANATLNIAGQAYTLVRDVAGLQALQSGLAGRYALAVDIDASSTATNGFTPIGNEAGTSVTTTNAFTGTFEGLGHTITGLTINRSGGTANAVGLFASTNNATLRNFQLVGGAVSGRMFVGAVAGYTNGSTTLSNVRSSATVTATTTDGSAVRAGGLVGLMAGSNAAAGVSDSVATGAVGATVANNTTANVGGLVGEVDAGSLSLVRSTGAVTVSLASGTNDVNITAGGLVGRHSGGAIANATATGNVSGGRYTGGLVGYLDAGSLNTVRSDGAVSGSGDAGGLLGYATGTGSLTTAEARGSVTSSSTTSYSVGGAVGYLALTGALSGITAAGNVSGGSFTGGVVGYYNPTTAISAATLGSVNHATKTITGGAWVGGFIGYMNQAASVTGLSASSTVVATATGGAAGGIIGRSSGAVSGSSAGGSVSGPAAVGGLVGVAAGSGGLSGSSASAAVSGTGTAGEVGGLVGRYNNTGNLDGGSASGAVQGGSGTSGITGGLVGNFDSTASIVNASTALTNTVTGFGDVGGLVGQAYGTGTAAITGATVRGTVQGGTAGGVGGLVGEFGMAGGWSSVTVEGAVTGGLYTGGLVGYYASSAPITNGTYTPASVTGGGYAGGIVGYMASSAAIAGTSAANPWVIGTQVTATSTSGAAGGLAGRTAGSVSNIRTTGTVTGADAAGGVIGRADGTGTLTQLRATGNVSSSSADAGVGGVVGTLSFAGSVNNATGTGTVSGGRYGGGVIGYFNGSAALQTLRGEGAVSSGGDAGGVVGYAGGSGSITDADGLGNVTSTDASNYSVGGAIGYFSLSGGLGDITAAGNVSGGAQTGGVVGYYAASTALTGTSLSYTNSASRTVTGAYWVGGLIGYSNASSITGLSSAATVAVSGTSSSASAGGLVGRTGGSVISSSASGSVTSPGRAGGLVGQADGTVNFTDSSASGAVSGANIAGGLIGYATGTAQLLRAGATGTVFTRATGGGLVGVLDSGGITDSNASGTVSGLSDGVAYVGGLVGQYGSGCYFCTLNANFTITNSHATGAVRADASAFYAGGLIGYVYSGVLVGVTASGNVTAVDSLNANSNEAVGGLVGYFGSYNQRSSITNSSASGAVTGGYYSGGLVGQYLGGALSNSSASGAVSGGVESGGLIGYANLYGPMTNVSASGAVTASGTAGSSRVGGLVGRMYFYTPDNITGGSLTNGSASGNVIGTAGSGEAGGLIGWLGAYNAETGPVNDSRATGNVTGGNTTGGLIGYFDNGGGHSALLNSHATGSVSGGAVVGGLVGNYNRTAATGRADDITNSYATGNVSGSTYLGGLVGLFDGRHGILGSYATGDVLANSSINDKYLGGLVGYYNTRHTSTSNLTDINASYATGRVSLQPGSVLASFADVYAGGLVGYMLGQTAGNAVVDAYATGAVTLAATSGRLYAGGLVGYATGGQSVLRGYATGAVSATGGTSRNAGGLLAGRASTVSVVTDSHWDSTTTGQASSLGGGTARSTAEMRQATSFSGWSLNTGGTGGTVWRLYEGQTAPLLSRFLTPRTLTLADASKVYDGTRSFGNATLTAVNGAIDRPERIFVTTTSADVGSYSIGAAGVYSVQNGYDLTVSGSATLTVTPRPITLAGVVADKVYDGTRSATLLTTAQPAGLVAGETLTVNTTGASATFDTRNVGQNKAVTITGLSLADGTGKASNYTLASASSSTASITPAPLNVGGFTATSRAYDGSVTVAVSANGGTVSGVIGSDDVTANVSGVTSGTVANKNVGTAKPVTVLGATLTGADAGNYTIAGINAVTVNITPRTLTVNGLRGNNRQYNQSTAVSVPTSTGELSGVVTGDVLQLRSTTINATMADRHAGTGKAVAVPGSSLQLRGVDAANYVVGDATATVDIARAIVYFYADYFGSSNDKVYDGNALASGVTPYAYPSTVGSYLLAGTTTYGLDNLVLTYDTPRYADKNVSYSGTTVISKTITASNAALGGTDAGNYVLDSTSATTSGRITPRSLAVTGVSATSRAYDGTANVSVNVSNAAVDTTQLVSGDNVTVTVPSSGTVVGTMLNKNAGTAKAVTVPGFSLSGTDALNYSLSGSAGVTVDITRKALTASYVAVDKVYDGNAYAALSVSSTDIVAGDVVRFFADQTYCTLCGYGFFATSGSTPTSYTTSKDAGTGKTVVVTTNGLFGADAGNYTLQNPTATLTGSITPKGITPVFTGVNKVYDGSTTATVNLNTSASGIFSGDAVSLTRTATFDTKDAGTGKTVSISGIAFTGAAAANYTLSTTTATTTAAITPKPLAVAGVTATDRNYDGSTNVALTVGTLGATGVVGGDVVTVVAPTGGLVNGTIATKGVGQAKPVTVAGLSLSGADAGNYSINGSQGVTVNITPRPLTAVYTGISREYNGGVSAAVSVASPDAVAGDVLTYTQNAIYTGLDARNVGTNKPIAVTSIVLGGTDAANYSLLNTSASTTGSITPKGITVSYTGLSRAYNGLADTSANVTGTSSGLVAGDQVGFSQTATFAGNGAVGTGKAVNVSGITLTGAQAANYSVLNSTATTTASITPRLIGVTGVLATSRVYDGTLTVQLSTAGATVLPSGVLAGDTVSVVLPSGGITTGTMATKDAGTNKPVTISGLTLTGASAANYAVGGEGLTVNITPRPLTATYSALDRVYNAGTTATVTGTSADILAGDVGALTIVASGAFTDGKNVGTGKAVAVSGGFLSGAERNNYSLVNPTGTATASITPRPLTASYTGGTRVYDGSVTAPVTASDAAVLAGDQLGFTQTAVFTGAGAKNVGNGKAIAISNIALTGADAANYVLLGTTASASGRITPKPISIDGITGATATPRVYDGTTTVAVVVSGGGTIAPSSADIVSGDTVTINLPAGGITTGTMANKNAGTGKAVAVDGLTLTGADAGNYVVAATTGITVDIARKALNAAYTGVNRVYDGSTVGSATGTSADIVFGDTVNITATGVFTGDGARNVGTGKTLSLLNGTLTGADAANYALVNTSGSTTASITPRPVTPAYTGLAKVYDGTTSALVQATGAGFISGDAVQLSQTAVFTGNKNVGTAKPIAVSGITLQGADAANYSLTATSAATTGSITPKPLRIDGLTGVSATDRVYDGSTTVNVVVSASGPIAPNPQDVVAGDVVTVTAPPTGNTTGTMADKHVGSSKPVAVAGLNLGGADAANYSITATSGVTVNITPRPLTAVYTATTREYDGSTAVAVTGSSADIVAGDTLTIAGTGAYTGNGARNAGTGKTANVLSMAFSGADAANYSLVNPTGTATGTITPRALVVSYSGGTRVYDGTTAAPVNGSVDRLVAGDDARLTQTAVFTGNGAKNVGTGKAVAVSNIALTGTDAANYTLNVSSSSTAANVTPRPLRIDGFTGVVASDRVYDGTTAVAITVQGGGSLGANAADLITGDDVTVVAPPSGSTAGTLADKNVGTNKPVTVAGVTLSGADAGNYTVAAATGVTVNITPRPLTAVWTGLSRVYDGSTAASLSGSSADILAGDVLTLSATGQFTGNGARNAGIGKSISFSNALLAGADALNYLLTNPSGTATADITPRTLNISYTGGTRVYDGTAVAPVSATLGGLVAGDTVATAQTAVFTGTGAKNVGDNKAVQVSAITLQGADAGNYAVASDTASATASITPRPLNVSGLSGLQAVNRVYDGTRDVQITGTLVVGSTSGNVIPGDDISVNLPGGSVNTGTMVDKNAGSGKAVAISGLSLGGADALNYQITGTAGLTVDIAPRPVALLGVAALNRLYDGTRVVALDTSGGSLQGALAGDNLQLLTSGVTGTVADKNAGTGKAVTVSGAGFGLGGSDAPNYSLLASGLTVDISPRSVVVTATGVDKVYDGNNLAQVVYGNDALAGDDLRVSAASSRFASANAGNGVAIAVNGLSLGGADAGNYRIDTPTLGTNANILRKAATLTANSPPDKVYGETMGLPGSAFSVSGLVQGESLGSVTLSSAGAEARANVGSYAITASNAGGGNVNLDNYLLSYVPGTLRVTPRPLTVAANSVVRFDDGQNPSSYGFSTSTGGLVNGDSIGAVAVTAPAASQGAKGVSVFTLQAAGAQFSSGSASNYSISYGNGLLLVLPTPPRVDDVNAGGGDGPQGLAVLADPVAVAAAEKLLTQLAAQITAPAEGTGARPATGGGPGEAAQPLTPEAATAAAQAVAALLSGDPARVNLPALQGLPLLSFEPSLRRLLAGAASFRNPPATPPAP
ncbi:YDG domain-containing protein [Rubrivivax rivuli]|nr:YDG domain-containing protein [Rubrivivax rivuli]